LGSGLAVPSALARLPVVRQRSGAGVDALGVVRPVVEAGLRAVCGRRDVGPAKARAHPVELEGLLELLVRQASLFGHDAATLFVVTRDDCELGSLCDR